MIKIKNNSLFIKTKLSIFIFLALLILSSFLSCDNTDGVDNGNFFGSLQVASNIGGGFSGVDTSDTSNGGSASNPVDDATTLNPPSRNDINAVKELKKQLIYVSTRDIGNQVVDRYYCADNQSPQLSDEKEMSIVKTDRVVDNSALDVHFFKIYEFAYNKDGTDNKYSPQCIVSVMEHPFGSCLNYTPENYELHNCGFYADNAEQKRTTYYYNIEGKVIAREIISLALKEDAAQVEFIANGSGTNKANFTVPKFKNSEHFDFVPVYEVFEDGSAMYYIQDKDGKVLTSNDTRFVSKANIGLMYYDTKQWCNVKTCNDYLISKIGNQTEFAIPVSFNVDDLNDYLLKNDMTYKELISQELNSSRLIKFLREKKLNFSLEYYEKLYIRVVVYAGSLPLCSLVYDEDGNETIYYNVPVSYFSNDKWTSIGVICPVSRVYVGASGDCMSAAYVTYTYRGNGEINGMCIENGGWTDIKNSSKFIWSLTIPFQNENKIGDDVFLHFKDRIETATPIVLYPFNTVMDYREINQY